MDRFRRGFGKSLARLAFAFGVPKVGYALFLLVLPWGIETENTANSRTWNMAVKRRSISRYAVQLRNLNRSAAVVSILLFKGSIIL